MNSVLLGSGVNQDKPLDPLQAMEAAESAFQVALAEMETLVEQLGARSEMWGAAGVVMSDGRIEAMAPDEGTMPLELESATRPGRHFLR